MPFSQNTFTNLYSAYQAGSSREFTFIVSKNLTSDNNLFTHEMSIILYRGKKFWNWKNFRLDTEY